MGDKPFCLTPNTYLKRWGDLPLTCSKVCMRAEEQNAFRGTKALIILSIVGVSFARHADMPG